MNGPFGLIFDVDGVIADTESINLRATAEAFAEILGIHGLRMEDLAPGIGRGAEAYVRAGARAHGRELTLPEVDSLVRRREALFLATLDREGLPPYPGVLDLFLSAQREANCRLAIATSSTREKSQSVLAAAGIPFAGVVRICGDEVTRKKPDPELFRIACARIQLPPADCVVVEDAPAGVAAAVAAGCPCIAVTNTHPREVLRQASLIVASLEEVTLETVGGLRSTS